MPAQPWEGPAGLSLGAPGQAAGGLGGRGEGGTGQAAAPQRTCPGRRRGAWGGGCGAARTQRRRAGRGGSELTGRAGAVHAHGLAAGAGKAALRSGVRARGRGRSRVGWRRAPWSRRLRAALPRAAPVPRGCAPHRSDRRARRAGHLLPAPSRRGGAWHAHLALRSRPPAGLLPAPRRPPPPPQPRPQYSSAPTPATLLAPEAPGTASRGLLTAEGPCVPKKRHT